MNAQYGNARNRRRSGPLTFGKSVVAGRKATQSDASFKRPDDEDDDAYVSAGGEFDRDTQYITTRITADGRDGYPVEPGRYRLIVARACPWANRAMIVRRLLGLEDVLSIGFCGPTHDKRSWTFDLDPGGVDPVLKVARLQDAYFARIPNYPRGITVPAIVEVSTGKVVTNDFARMTLDLSTEWEAYHRTGAPQLYPEHLRDENNDVARRIYVEDPSGRPVAAFDPAILAGLNAADPSAAPNLWPQWQHLKPISILAIRGALSDILSAEILASMAAQHPNLRAITVANRGHAPMLDEPAAVAAIDEFLHSLETIQ